MKWLERVVLIITWVAIARLVKELYDVLKANDDSRRSANGDATVDD